MATKNQAAPDAAQGADTDLQAQVDQLTSENSQLTSENGQLKGQIISLSSDRDTLAEANQKLAGELQEKTDELAHAEALIEEQSGKLAAAEVGQAEGPVIVTHERSQYRVLAPKFSHHGLDVDARTLRQNPELVRQLVEAGSGLLQKVEAAS